MGQAIPNKKLTEGQEMLENNEDNMGLLIFNPHENENPMDPKA